MGAEIGHSAYEGPGRAGWSDDDGCTSHRRPHRGDRGRRAGRGVAGVLLPAPFPAAPRSQGDARRRRLDPPAPRGADVGLRPGARVGRRELRPPRQLRGGGGAADAVPPRHAPAAGRATGAARGAGRDAGPRQRRGRLRPRHRHATGVGTDRGGRLPRPAHVAAQPSGDGARPGARAGPRLPLRTRPRRRRNRPRRAQARERRAGSRGR